MNVKNGSSGVLVKGSKLGSGTYSKVYKAVDSEGAELAIKVNLCESELDFKCCVRELDINSSINHPCVVSLREVREGNPFGKSELMSPLSNGSDLRANSVHFVYPLAKCDMLDYVRTNHVPLKELKRLMSQMLLALEYVHSMEIVHRDVKIDNFLVFEENGSVVCKLADFGMAKQYVVNQQLTPGICVPYCRPPECCLRNRAYDFKVDVWGLGCVFCEMLNGVPPIPIMSFKGMSPSQINCATLENIHRRVPGIPAFEILRDYPRASLVDARPSVYSLVSLGHLRSDEMRSLGLYECFHSLVGGMFAYCPAERYSMAECLDHRFFVDEFPKIREVRRECQPRKREETNYLLCFNNGRSHMIEVAKNVFSRRNKLIWYSHRILFHAIVMFDEILLRIDRHKKYLDSRQVAVYFRMTIYVFVKYFYSLCRESVIPFSRLDNSLIISDGEINEAVKFENYIMELLGYSIYKETLYDRMCKNGKCSESDVASSLDFLLGGHHHNLTLTEAYRKWVSSK